MGTYGITIKIISLVYFVFLQTLFQKNKIVSNDSSNKNKRFINCMI